MKVEGNSHFQNQPVQSGIRNLIVIKSIVAAHPTFGRYIIYRSRNGKNRPIYWKRLAKKLNYRYINPAIVNGRKYLDNCWNNIFLIFLIFFIWLKKIMWKRNMCKVCSSEKLAFIPRVKGYYQFNIISYYRLCLFLIVDLKTPTPFILQWTRFAGNIKDLTVPGLSQKNEIRPIQLNKSHLI